MEDFDSLDMYAKSDILKRKATYLLEIQIENYCVKLYAWDRCFIEKHTDDEQQVIRINIAERSDMLKYLKMISLGDLGHPTVV